MIALVPHSLKALHSFLDTPRLSRSSNSCMSPNTVDHMLRTKGTLLTATIEISG